MVHICFHVFVKGLADLGGSVYPPIHVSDQLSLMHVVVCVGESRDTVYPCKKEHIDDIRYTEMDVSQLGLLHIWVCLCHHKDHIYSRFLAADQVIGSP